MFISQKFTLTFSKRMASIKAALRSMPLWSWAMVVIVIGWFLTALWTPYMGDDLAYLSCFEGVNHSHRWSQYLRWMGGHWLTVNGRFGNFVLPILIVMPRWIAALFSALALGLMYWLVKKASKVNTDYIAMFEAGCVFFLLTWWDSIYLFACQTNYIWSSVMALVFYLLLFASRRINVLLAAIISFMAGLGHEGLSAAIVFGLAGYWVINRPRFNRYQILCIVSFILGAMFVIFSPAVVMRIFSTSAPDDPFPILILKSDYLSIALLIAVAVIALIPARRPTLTRIFRTPLCVLTLASFASIIVSNSSGIVGRSGWFGQLFAIIVFFYWIRPRNGKLSRVGAMLLFGALLLVQIFCAIWQKRIFDEYQVFENLYMKSPDGIVYMDCIKDDEIPAALTLNRLRAIPDDDDAYLNDVIAAFYRADGQTPKVLPPAARTYVENGLTVPVMLDGRYLIMPAMPDSSYNVPTYKRGVEYSVKKIDGKEWIIKPAGNIFYMTPRIVDPGDRDRVW